MHSSTLGLFQAAMIWFRPVIALSTCSDLACPIFRLNRWTERVGIWLTFTQDCFGKFASVSSKVRGNPARCSWLVSAMAMTVPER